MRIKTSEEIVMKIASYPAEISFDELPNIKWIALDDIIKELNDIINNLNNHSCDIDSSVIGELIEELENAK